MRSDPSLVPVPADLARLLERVDAQQIQLQDVIANLDVWSREMDATIASAVQRSLMEAAGMRAAQTLSQIHQATGARFARWSLGIVGVCALLPSLMSWTLMPSRVQLSQLHDSMRQSSAGMVQLPHDGGQVELRHCGAARRLCARVDRKSPTYGQDGDFMVLKGY